MADASADKFSYSGATPADQQMDLLGERTAPRRADLLDKSRMMTVPPRQSAEVKEGGNAGDKRTPEEIAMDAEVARLQEVDRPAQSTFSPLDVIGPGAFRYASRVAPDLVGAVARTMRRAPEPEKPPALEQYGPLRGDRDWHLPPGMGGDISMSRFIPQRMRELHEGRAQWSPETLVQRFGAEGYTVDDVMRILGNAAP